MVNAGQGTLDEEQAVGDELSSGQPEETMV